MAAGIIILLIVAASLPIGWLILRQLVTGERPFNSTLLELVFASLTLGIITMGWIALVLAELGWFSIFWLALLWSGLLAALVWRTWRRQFSWTIPRLYNREDRRLLPLVPGWVEHLALVVWLLAAVWLFFRPHQFVIGAADAGVYVNLGAEIAAKGSILIQDDLLAELDPALYPAFLRPLDDMAIASYYILPGFYVSGDPVGEIAPQFYHLHPVWQAVANDLGGGSDNGVQAELLLPGLWGLLGALGVYFTVRRMMGWETALLALTGLSLNALQIWFARYPTTETFTQFLLWAGFWSLGVWLESPGKRPYWGLLAGLAVGQSFLVRIDMLFVLPVLGLFGLWLWVRDGWKRDYNWFFLPLLLLVLHSLLHALWQSRPYFFELFGFALNLLRINWYIPVGAGIGGVILLLGLSRYRRQFIRLGRYQLQFLVGLIFVFVLWALYGWFVRPSLGQATVWNDPYSEGAIPQLNHENLIRLGWYLSPVGIWLGVAGIGLLIWQANRGTAVMLAVSLLIALIYLTNIRANPHQIYAMRRYVPVVMPLFIVGGACFLGWLVAHKKIWLSSAALILTVAWLGGFVWLARGFISQVDYQGILPQIDQLAGQFAPGAVLIFNDAAPISQGDIIGTPLRFLKGYDVLTLRDPEALDSQQFEQTLRRWQMQGHSVYWLMVPDGYEWPLIRWTLDEAGAYDIQVTALEGTFDRRPSQLQALRWRGQFALIQPEE